MKKLSAENINISVINLISDVAEKEDVEIYLVGGFVRDLIIERKSKDIDVLVIGNGIDFANVVAKKTNGKIQVFKNFGTAMLRTKDYEIEFESTFKLSDEKLNEHWDICEEYNIVDFELGNKLTGAGFPVYKGKGAALQRALINYFLDKNTSSGYTLSLIHI